MSGEIKVAVDKVVKNVNQQVRSRGERAVNAIRNAELEVLSGQRSGRVYRKPHTKRATYTASAPCEPPARRTGNLRLRWSGKVTGKSSGNTVHITATLTSNSKYAGYLENGTSKMAARPFVEKIEEKALPKIRDIYNEPYG